MPMSRDGGAWKVAVSTVKAVGQLPPLLRVAAIVVAVLAALGITLGVLGWMKPAASTKKDNSDSTQSITFSYSATVKPSAAYDTTTVTSPDPIFRKLTDEVDLHLSYQGMPGAISVSAVLSDGTGWHSAMLIAPLTRFAEQTYDMTMHLNLSVFDQRAKLAAHAIGSGANSLVVEMRAQVTTRGEHIFTAPLTFNLAPLAFTLANGANSLVVQGPGALSAPILQQREISVLGYSIMAAAEARSYAAMLLIVALISAAAIALIGRRDGPVRSRADIERRHSQLLVHVEPMASPPGKPVVTVDNFAELVKLAERYGQMILTWTRADADDFIVRDEGITYRYRIPLTDGESAPHLVNVEAPLRRRRAETKTKVDATENN